MARAVFGIVALFTGRPLVAAREAHHALRALEDLVAVEARASAAVAREPAHLALHPGADESVVSLDVSIEAHVGAGDRNRVETELSSFRSNPLSERARDGIMIGK